MFRRVLRTLFGIGRALGSKGTAAPPASLADPRAQDPWVAALLTTLGDRYQLGPDKPDGIQVMRRTGRARFNPMMVFLQPPDRAVLGLYEVRGHGAAPADDARKLLDARITAELGRRGLSPGAEKVEEWGGTVLIRRYQGRCDDAAVAASAVRFMCQESDQVMDTAAE